MKRVSLRSTNKPLLKKVEQALAETVIHRRQFQVSGGVWPFVVVGPDARGNAVIREGVAEQSRIQSAPLYLATAAGPHIPDADGIPIEELAGGDVPKELEGLKICQLSPMRPLAVTAKRLGPPVREALREILDANPSGDRAVIETPDEAFWALSVLMYLDESDRFFPDPVLADFYSRLGHTAAQHQLH